MSIAMMIGLYLAGLLAEIFGLLCMSHRYVEPARARDLPALWLSALFRGKQARGSARRVEMAADPDRANLLTLQGLALIGLGFALQAVVAVVSLLRSRGP